MSQQHMNYNEGYQVRDDDYPRGPIEEPGPRDELNYRTGPEYSHSRPQYQTFEQPASTYQGMQGKVQPQKKDETKSQRFVLAIVSLGILIPLSAISLEEAGLLGLLIVGAIVVGINLAFSFRKHPF